MEKWETENWNGQIRPSLVKRHVLLQAWLAQAANSDHLCHFGGAGWGSTELEGWKEGAWRSRRQLSVLSEMSRIEHGRSADVLRELYCIGFGKLNSKDCKCVRKDIELLLNFLQITFWQRNRFTSPFHIMVLVMGTIFGGSHSPWLQRELDVVLPIHSQQKKKKLQVICSSHDELGGDIIRDRKCWVQNHFFSSFCSPFIWSSSHVFPLSPSSSFIL